MATDNNGSPLAQLREFLVERFVGSGELEGFVEEHLLEVGPEVGWDGSLTNQARDLTTAVMNQGLLDRLWPALKSARPELTQEIDLLSALDWTARTRSRALQPQVDKKWLAGGASALVLLIVSVVAFAVSRGDDEPLSTATTNRSPALATEQDGPTAALSVTSIRAFNGDQPAEQSAIQLLVSNRGDVPVNVDRVTFTVLRSGSADCKILGFTGEGALFARGAQLAAYSVPIYEYNDSSDQSGRLILNPPRRFEADSEETLLLFDLDETRGTPEGDPIPPYFDERFLLDGEEQIGFVVFEIRIALETTGGETVDAGTVVVAHPRLIPGLLSADGISEECGWDVTNVNTDGLDPFSEKLLSNRAQISQFCDSPVVRGLIGANEQLDVALRSVDTCG